jgi:lysophospholipase L1-like esterase
MKGNLVLLIVSVTITLILGEIVVRIFYDVPPSTMSTFNLSESSYYRRDDALDWVPNPNVSGVHDRSGSFATTFQTNSFGLRDREYPLEKPAGITRIVVVGDSFAWGFGVNNGEIFTDALEEMLPDTEVLNLGVTAYGLRQEMLYFDRLGIRFDPDILIVALTQNDIMRAHEWLPERPGRQKPQALPATNAGDPDEGLVLTAKNYLQDNLRLYRLVRNVLMTNRTFVNLAVDLGIKDELAGYNDLDVNLTASLREYPERLTQAFEQLNIHLKQFHESTQASDIRMIVALVPARQSVDETALKQTLATSSYWVDDFDLDKPYGMLAQFADANDIELIDAMPRFRIEVQNDADLYIPYDMHFNPAGHVLYAEIIARHLNQQ